MAKEGESTLQRYSIYVLFFISNFHRLKSIADAWQVPHEKIPVDDANIADNKKGWLRNRAETRFTEIPKIAGILSNRSSFTEMTPGKDRIISRAPSSTTLRATSIANCMLTSLIGFAYGVMTTTMP